MAETDFSSKMTLKAFNLFGKASYLQLTEIRPPAAFHKMEPEVLCEVSRIGDKRSDEEDIPTHCTFLVLQIFNVLRPANFF